MSRVVLALLVVVATCGIALHFYWHQVERTPLHVKLDRLLEEQARENDASPANSRTAWLRGDRISELRALIRFQDSMGRPPREDEKLEEFDARLVMRRLEGLLSEAISDLENHNTEHGEYPHALSVAGIDLNNEQLDLGFEPLYGERRPVIVYWPLPDRQSYAFGVRMHCNAWFGLAPNMWVLDFLTSPRPLETHPDYDGFERYYTEGRWAVWYD